MRALRPIIFFFPRPEFTAVAITHIFPQSRSGRRACISRWRAGVFRVRKHVGRVYAWLRGKMHRAKISRSFSLYARQFLPHPFTTVPFPSCLRLSNECIFHRCVRIRAAPAMSIFRCWRREHPRRVCTFITGEIARNSSRWNASGGYGRCEQECT